MSDGMMDAYRRREREWQRTWEPSAFFRAIERLDPVRRRWRLALSGHRAYWQARKLRESTETSATREKETIDV